MSIYASNKALFEHCLDLALSDARDGKAAKAWERRETLLQAYSELTDCLERDLERRVKLATLKPPRILIASKINDN